MLPPPAESLYSLPRRLATQQQPAQPQQSQPSTSKVEIASGSVSASGVASNCTLSTEQLLAGEDATDSGSCSLTYQPHQMLEQLKKMRVHKQNTESVV